MPTSRTITLGECIGSLAAEFGFADHNRIYGDGANAQLKSDRPNPNVLAEGDVVSVPDIVQKWTARSTDATHRFIVKVAPALLRIVVQDDAAAAIAGKRYKLQVGYKEFSGTTGGDGKIEHSIDGDASSGTLNLWLKEGEGIEGLVFSLELGSLEHESVDRACQARLINLNFDCGDLSGTLDDRGADAIRGFQKNSGLPVNASLDAATRDKLRTLHEGA